MQALQISLSQAKTLLGIFAMESLKNTDPWLTPLWRAGERYYLLVPVALTSNPRRLFEHWLTLGGIDLGVRGGLFEKYVREQCIKAISKSTLLGDVARCTPAGIELDRTIGDMDLVCAIGNTVLIGETKCTTTPASAVERSNYYGVLHDAVEQVTRKIAHARTNLAELESKTGWHLENPKIAGVIVTDQELGVGQLINGIPVVDHLILTKYLQEGELEHGVTFADDGTKQVIQTAKFYTSPNEAEQNLEGYLSAPPQLRLALRFVSVTETPLLTAPGDKPAAHRGFDVRVPADLKPIK